MDRTDKELIRKYHLEEAQKRVQMISEYSVITKPLLSEEGDEDNQQQQPAGGNPPMNGQQQPPMPQQDNFGMPPQNNGNPAPDNSQPPMGNMDGNQPADMQQQPPMPPVNGEEGDMDVDFNADEEGEENTDTMQDGDEVIDVDELTNAQETVDAKIDGFDDKLQNLLAVTKKFIQAVDQNNRKIDDLKIEFERRNPSQEEKLNIRSQASAPYSESPKDFWDRKAENSNYNVIFNNDVDPSKEDKEYVIRKSDINSNDDRGLSKSLDYPTKLSDYLDF